jgi:hypothetical protein
MWSPLRWAFDRIWAREAAEGSGTAQLITRLTPSGRPVLTFTKGLALGSLSVLVAIGIVVAGAPARDSAAASGTGPVSLPVDLDVAGLPVVTIDDSTDQLDISIDENVAGDLAVMLAENLALEAEAIRTADAELLSFADGGERVTEIQARIDDAITSGKRVADHYQLESLLLRLADESEGQASAALAFDAEGIVSTVTYDANGREVNSSSRSFATTFVLRQMAGDRWLIVTEVGG